MLGLLLVLFVSLIVNVIVAGKFREIAEMKGHDGEEYFWYTMFLGVVGMLMVVALPDERSITVKNMPTVLSAPNTTVNSTQTSVTGSSAATEKNPKKESDPVIAEIKDGEKVCPKCGTAQKMDRTVCWSCGQRFDN